MPEPHQPSSNPALETLFLRCKEHGITYLRTMTFTLLKRSTDSVPETAQDALDNPTHSTP
jgi:hypothetical protein